MNPLPAYKPRETLSESYPRNFDKCVAQYGRAPKGYRWLKVGDHLKKGDIHCSLGEWRYVQFFTAPIYSCTNPVARPVEGTKIVFPLEKLLSRKVDLIFRDVPLKTALRTLTRKSIEDGCFEKQTVLDLRNALVEAIRILEKKG